MTTVRRRAVGRARFWAGFRCAEPVVVLESDDWGLRRHASRGVVAGWGTPTGWADEEAETVADLDRLAEVLARHRDPEGRPAAFTLNVITANADFDAIEADDYAAYHDRPVDETMHPAVRSGFRAGADAGLFSLQLHGRSHLDVERWMADLRDGHPAARALFAARVDGGLSLVAEESWRYHSEFLTWTSGNRRSADDLLTWLTPSIDTIERLSGERPRSAVAPHYVLSDEAESAWAALGIEFVQATERQLTPHRERARASYLGQTGGHGLVHLTRTVRFDPRPQRTGHHVDETMVRLRRCFEQGLPAVIDLHRINVTGPWADDAVGELDVLLDLADRAGAHYLTTPELGSAVIAGGAFADRVTGAPRHLTPVGAVPRALTRPLLARPGRSRR